MMTNVKTFTVEFFSEFDKLTSKFLVTGSLPLDAKSANN